MPEQHIGDTADSRRDALLKEYGEVANIFRLLTDIRFKLLAFLPIATAAAAALKGTGDVTPAAAVATLGLSLFGLVVTGALVSYNTRNNQLYNELVGRAAAIEREMDLPDGAFAHRPTPLFTIRLLGRPVWSLDHGRSVALIYLASIALWLFSVFYSAAQLACEGKQPAAWLVGAGLASISALTIGGAWAISRQHKSRRNDMRTAAAAAVLIAQKTLNAPTHRELFRALCVGLLSNKDGASKTFRGLCEGLRRKDGFARLDECAHACDQLSNSRTARTIRARAQFYSQQFQENVGYWVPRDARHALTVPSYFVALITDLPPQWILDNATGRRREPVELRGLQG